MNKLTYICAITLAVSACATPQGNGFNNYEVDAKKGGGAQVVEVQWQALKPIPRYRVALAESAQAAASVHPLAQSPQSSVNAVSAPGVGLRIVEDSTQVWLVAETGNKGVPDTPGLRNEATRRSGCLVSGVTTAGSATVFQLNCR